ncbi:uncharacterized protein [Antedon mediterranea]|uniref:uncharacterized protein n=1 Tax=Antedon mediterranea TaxID=105859 RepID=UPI003AF8DA7B
MAAEKKQIRVMLWCVPRAGSTAFLRCISNRDDVKAFRELFVACTFFGPEARLDITGKMNVAVEEDLTFKKVKAKLEADYDAPIVFAKDGVEVIYGNYECLPTGYTHTFLIKSPHKVHMSKKSLFEKAMKQFGISDAGYDKACITSNIGSPFYEMLELVKYVRDELKQNIILIDGDDLIANPEAMMKKWCEAVGVPFKPDMMNWEQNGDIKWEMSEGHKMFMKLTPEASKNAFNSTGFSTRVATDHSKTDVPEDVRKCIEDSDPFYKDLYKMRMTLD